MINYSDPNMLRNNVTQALMQQQAAPRPQLSAPAGASMIPSAAGQTPPPSPAPSSLPAPPALGAGQFASSNLAPGSSPLGAPSPGAGVQSAPLDTTPATMPSMAPPPMTTPKLTTGLASKPAGYGGIDPSILAQLTGVRS